MRARESTRFPCVGSSTNSSPFTCTSCSAALTHGIVNWAWGLGSPSTRTPGPHGPTRMDNRGLGRITAPAPDPRGTVVASLACCFRIELSRWRVDPGPQVREGAGCRRVAWRGHQALFRLRGVLTYCAHAAVKSFSMVLGRPGVLLQPTPPTPTGRPGRGNLPARRRAHGPVWLGAPHEISKM